MRQFVGFMVAGYPSREESIGVIRDCCAAGLDVLELGFPARDASMDGPVIRAADALVDPALAEDLPYWREIRRVVSIPIWLMGYREDLLREDICFRLAEEGLYDALVIPDMTETERAALRQRLTPLGIQVMGFINGEQSPAERDLALREAELIYHQLYCGETGIAHNDSGYLQLYEYARAHTRAKIYAGFGISTPERVRELLGHGYDGTIIGSAIMQHLLEGEAGALAFIRQVHETTRATDPAGEEKA
ncbi:MAG: tryptophan synthase subunit alpha [Clostridia bacterium]|nr:tryptophan synthase subunit alpha [Clostridia bacterium]